jgi:hypothetical protein
VAFMSQIARLAAGVAVVYPSGDVQPFVPRLVVRPPALGYKYTGSYLRGICIGCNNVPI